MEKIKPRIKILTVSDHPGSTNCIVPLVKAMKKKYLITSIAFNTSKDIFKENNMSYKTINKFGFRELSISSVNKILVKIRPDLLIFGNSGPNSPENYFLYVAKQMKIKTVCVLDITRERYDNIFDIKLNNKTFRATPDKVCVLNKKVKNSLIKTGISKKSIVVTGGPNFDYLLNYKKINIRKIKKLKKRHKLNENNKIILWISQPQRLDHPTVRDFSEITALKDFINILKKSKTKDKMMLVRLHPRENGKEIKKIINKEKDINIRLISYKMPLINGILLSDLIVGMDSTVLYEAALLGKKVISYFPTKEIGMVLPKNNIIAFAKTKRQFERIFLRLINKKHRNKSVTFRPATPKFVKIIEKELYKS